MVAPAHGDGRRRGQAHRVHLQGIPDLLHWPAGCHDAACGCSRLVQGRMPSIAGQHAFTLLHSGHQPLLAITAAAWTGARADCSTLRQQQKLLGGISHVGALGLKVRQRPAVDTSWHTSTLQPQAGLHRDRQAHRGSQLLGTSICLRGCIRAARVLVRPRSLSLPTSRL